MKFRILIVLIASVGLAVSGLANAVPITHYGYTLNPTTNIVTHTDGTEWLQWDVTKGQSISDALDTYAGAGWVLAGNAQMAALFGNFGWEVGTDENTSYDAYDSYTNGADDSTYDEFLDLFGLTYFGSGAADGFGDGVDAYEAVSILFGDDADGNGKYNVASVGSDFRFYPRDGGVQLYGYNANVGGALRYCGCQTIYVNGPNLGIALTRTAYVSEPASLAIFALGTFGLALRRFKKQS
jgi:hypothetical protein